MEDLLTLADAFPRRTLAPGEVLLVDGQSSPPLFVLIEGALRVEKSGVGITTVTSGPALELLITR